MTDPLNVAAHLARMAAAAPGRAALYAPARRVSATGHTPHRTITFAELNADADAIAHGLARLGVARGTRVALMVPPSPDFFALTFALFKLAAVPVLIDPGMGVRNLGTCLGEAEPHAFIGIAKAHVARRVLGWAKRTVRATVNAGRWRFFCTSSLARLRRAGAAEGAYPVPEVTADETAAILFTSGSTGVAKGAVYTHGIFAAQVDALKAVYGIEPGEIDLCTFPLFALFGPALGMTCVIPDMNPARPAQIDPHKAAAQIAQFGVTNMFGSPAVIRRMGELVDQPTPPGPPSLKGRGEKELGRSNNSHGAPVPNSPLPFREGGPEGVGRLPTLRRAISAGAPASPVALERFAQLLPKGAQVFTPYGATEALPVANIGSDEILRETRALTEQGKGVCVGAPVPGVEVRVIRISDEPIPEWSDDLLAPAGEVGEFVVRGPIVTREYFNRPTATALAKIRDPRTGEVFHRMGDVGYLDARGRLWFCGRKSHRVITPHGTLFTDMVEPVFNTGPGVLRTALVGVTRNGVTHPVLCVEFSQPTIWIPKSQPWTLRLAESQLRKIGARHNHTRGIVTFLEHRGFPVDVRHNSKIFREKLAVWADQQLGPKWTPEAT